MSEQRKMKSYEELRYSDDFMFSKVMEDPELCREVLQCLLQRPISELKEVQTQRQLTYTADGKPVRLDLYNRDSEGAVYDVEMQNLNHKKVEDLQLPRRSRFYQSSIDIDYMDKGNSYKDLPESSVLFICTFDPFGKGMGVYTFREYCEEMPGYRLNDGTVKIFYNCCYKGDDIAEGLRKLYDYIENGKTDDDLTRKIEAAVSLGRKNYVWRTQYMKLRTMLMDEREEGREEGIKEGIKEGGDIRDNERISNMLRRGKTVDEIVDFCGYPKEQVEKVEKSMLTS